MDDTVYLAPDSAFLYQSLLRTTMARAIQQALASSSPSSIIRQVTRKPSFDRSPRLSSPALSTILKHVLIPSRIGLPVDQSLLGSPKILSFLQLPISSFLSDLR